MFWNLLATFTPYWFQFASILLHIWQWYLFTKCVCANYAECTMHMVCVICLPRVLKFIVAARHFIPLIKMRGTKLDTKKKIIITSERKFVKCCPTYCLVFDFQLAAWRRISEMMVTMMQESVVLCIVSILVIVLCVYTVEWIGRIA